MKTTFLSLLFLGFGSIVVAQQDTSMVNRLNEVLKFTQLKDMDRVLDYTYPKLFTIVPRSAMTDAMKEAYENDDFTIELDSLKIDTIFPVFKIKDTSYVKVKHTMLMRMKFKEPFDSTDKESKDFMISLMGEKFGAENVRFDPGANSLNIFTMPDIVGIKTKTANWTFVNLNADNPAMLEMLFSKQVLDKLKEFK